MPIFLILAIVFIGAPIARAIARSIERQGLNVPKGEDVELRKQLLLTEQRLSESETRLAALEERVDFYEKLLANPTSSSKSEPQNPQS